MRVPHRGPIRWNIITAISWIARDLWAMYTNLVLGLGLFTAISPWSRAVTYNILYFIVSWPIYIPAVYYTVISAPIIIIPCTHRSQNYCGDLISLINEHVRPRSI